MDQAWLLSLKGFWDACQEHNVKGLGFWLLVFTLFIRHASHNSCTIHRSAGATLQRSISHCPQSSPDCMWRRCKVRKAASLGNACRRMCKTWPAC